MEATHVEKKEEGPVYCVSCVLFPATHACPQCHKKRWCSACRADRPDTWTCHQGSCALAPAPAPSISAPSTFCSVCSSSLALRKCFKCERLRWCEACAEDVPSPRVCRACTEEYFYRCYTPTCPNPSKVRCKRCRCLSWCQACVDQSNASLTICPACQVALRTKPAQPQCTACQTEYAYISVLFPSSCFWSVLEGRANK
jgi:hypothetical protein